MRTTLLDTDKAKLGELVAGRSATFAFDRETGRIRELAEIKEGTDTNSL